MRFKNTITRMAIAVNADNYDNLCYILCYLLFIISILTLFILPFADMAQNSNTAVRAVHENIEATDINNGTYNQSDTEEITFPLNGVITSGYGWRSNPFNGSDSVWAGSGYEFHHGIDIAANKSQDVAAYRNGIVDYIGSNEGYGNYIVLSHQNHKSLYAHLKDISVSVGENVKGGQIIATAGSTGRSTGPHLHFEIRIDDIAVDPMTYVAEYYK